MVVHTTSEAKETGISLKTAAQTTEPPGKWRPGTLGQAEIPQGTGDTKHSQKVINLIPP